jgi:CRISPR-associated protein Cmr3
MSVVLQLTPHDPLIARDGRPFGAGQGNRMRGLPWPLPSVVAGSFRTALVKATPGLDFSGDMPERLLKIAVAGVFPVHAGQLYLAAPNDCAWDDKTEKVHRVQPIQLQAGEGVDFPDAAQGIMPVRLTAEQATEDFKAKNPPEWWPLSKYQEWLTSSAKQYPSDWFSPEFFSSPRQAMRDHVALDAGRGAAAEGNIFATANLHVTHMPRFGVKLDDDKIPFSDRFVEVTLSARVTIPDDEPALKLDNKFKLWHPLGGERRLVHWKPCQQTVTGWDCPQSIRDALANTSHVRMILATPAIFAGGWKPGWLNDQLEGTPPGCAVKLKLVGVSNSRWKAVSGWDLVKRDPKAIRRMVPAGSVYFFTCERGAAAKLADLWLKPISDDDRARRDGFGLALWGTW